MKAKDLMVKAMQASQYRNRLFWRRLRVNKAGD